MIAGHFATALVPYELTRKQHPVPLWLFFLASQFLDFVMLILVSLGVEKLEPADAFSVAFNGLQTDMYVSHDVLPVVGWAALFGVLTWLVWRKPVVALWCAGLVVLHELCDLVVGFPHEVMRGIGPVGLALYLRAPILGFLIEAVFAAAIVFWFCRRRANSGNPVSTGTQTALYAILVGTTLLTLPLAKSSLYSLLGL
ncbi:MAG: hypothetical protein WCE62_19355 [Polyangiales bacterium]